MKKYGSQVENPHVEDAEESITNRHFFRLLLNSVLVGTVLIGGFTFGNSETLAALGAHRPMTMLEHSGAVLLNASELEDHISLPMHAGHHRYWLGPIAGSRYTTNCVTPGVLQVDYFRDNQALTDGSQPFISITADENQATHDNKLRPLTDHSMTIMTNSHGDSFAIDTTSLTQIVILPKSSREVITIDYSTSQTILSMMRDSESLVKL